MSYIENVNPQGISTGGFFPTETQDLAEGTTEQLRIDVAGSLKTRGPVLTDEGSYYDPFAGAAISADWTTVVGTGASITVANSICTIAAGTTAGANTGFYKTVDFEPLNAAVTMSISQRIANQDHYLWFGTADAATGSTLGTQFAGFHFYGTDNSKVSCETRSSADTGGTEGVNTQLLLPLGITTATSAIYKVVITGKGVEFYAGKSLNLMNLVAIRSIQTPNPYQVLVIGVRTLNGTTPASPTTLNVDTVRIENFDNLSVINATTTAVNQSVVTSAVNSSLTNLAGGATFTGVGETTLGVNSIQVSLKTDQNCTVYVDQSPDGTNWDIVDSYNYYTTTAFGVTVQAVASFYRIRVLNKNATTTTTYFRLQSVLCPMAEPLPRTLTQEQHLAVSVEKIQNENGIAVYSTPYRELQVETPHKLLGSAFYGTTLDPNFWTSTVTNGGTNAQGGGFVNVRTNTTANGTARIDSLRTSRYIPGHALRFNVQVIQTVGTANNTRLWGFTDGTDGMYFKLNGTGFEVVTMNNTTEAPVTSGDFNGELGATYVVDANNHSYQILCTNGKAWFYVDNVLLHSIGTTTTRLTQTLNLPMRISNVNAGGSTTDIQMKVITASAARLGDVTHQPTSYFTSVQVSVVLKYGAGNLHGILLGGKANGGAVTLYDNTAASGRILWASGTIQNSTNFSIDFFKIPFFIGLTLVVGSQDENVTIAYE